MAINFLTQNGSAPIGVGLRLASMLLDHFFMTMIAMVFFLPGFISEMVPAFNPSHDGPTPDFMDGVYGYGVLPSGYWVSR